MWLDHSGDDSSGGDDSGLDDGGKRKGSESPLLSISIVEWFMLQRITPCDPSILN